MGNFFLVGLVEVIFGAVVLSYLPYGLTAPKDVILEKVANLNRVDTVPASRYTVSGDREGKVTVRDTISGKEIRTGRRLRVKS